MALINLRNALMTGNRLPYDAEVEFLESTGTQWINTGVPGVDGYTFKADFMYTSLYSSYNYIAGSNGGSTNRIYFTRLDRTSGLFRMTYNNSAGGSYYGVAVGERYKLETVARRGFQSVKVDGVEVYGNNIATTVNTGINFFIFAASSVGGSGTTGECAAKLYSAQFYDSNGTLVRDYIPVRKGTVGYLYDRVSGTLFGNAGTGAFTYGNDLPYPIPA